MRRRLEIGDTITMRADGTWRTDFIMRVLDDEPVPSTPAEVEAFVRKDIDDHPVLRGAADAACIGISDPLGRAVAAARAVHGHPHPRAASWRGKRNVSTNEGNSRHPDQG